MNTIEGGSVPFVPFFSDAGAVQRLRTEAAKLRGTRFMVKDRDCIWLAESLHVAGGSVKAFNFPRSDADYSRHVHNNKIFDYLRGLADDPQSKILSERFVELALPEKKQLSAYRFEYQPPFMCGDLIILRTGKGLWHMPVMLNDRAFMQCVAPDGVTEGDILAPNYHAHLVAVFRARALPSADSAIRNPQSAI